MAPHQNSSKLKYTRAFGEIKPCSRARYLVMVCVGQDGRRAREAHRSLLSCALVAPFISGVVFVVLVSVVVVVDVVDKHRHHSTTRWDFARSLRPVKLYMYHSIPNTLRMRQRVAFHIFRTSIELARHCRRHWHIALLLSSPLMLSHRRRFFFTICLCGPPRWIDARDIFRAYVDKSKQKRTSAPKVMRMR